MRSLALCSAHVCGASRLKADFYSTRPQVRLGACGKYDFIAVLAEVRFECICVKQKQFD